MHYELTRHVFCSIYSHSDAFCWNKYFNIHMMSSFFEEEWSNDAPKVSLWELKLKAG